ncbi:MAG: DUF4381 domain-containing protein [Marinibacterium sp.]
MNGDFDGLSLVDLIDLLEPAPEPPAISMLPQTAGWIWLALAVLLAGVWLINRWAAARRRQAYRRAALHALVAAGDDAAAIAAILRRTALAAYPRSEVAGLTGAAWLDFLDRTYGGTGFSGGPGRILARAPYQPCPTDPLLQPLARDWITRYRVPEQ